MPNPIARALADADRITAANQAIADGNVAALNQIDDPNLFEVVGVTYFDRSTNQEA